jgi:hypothetical protein
MHGDTTQVCSELELILKASAVTILCQPYLSREKRASESQKLNPKNPFAMPRNMNQKPIYTHVYPVYTRSKS